MSMKSGRPETVRQAANWDCNKGRYLRQGLCGTCAAQAAWGHQIGFTRSRPPCHACVPAVAGFPTEAANGWRKTK